MFHTSAITFTASPLPIQTALHYGRGRTPLALIVPDHDWVGMYRIIWSDGQMSDMVNLPRAKDAAEAICERGPPARNRRLFHWHTSRRARTAPPVTPPPPPATTLALAPIHAATETTAPVPRLAATGGT